MIMLKRKKAPARVELHIVGGVPQWVVNGKTSTRESALDALNSIHGGDDVFIITSVDFVPRRIVFVAPMSISDALLYDATSYDLSHLGMIEIEREFTRREEYEHGQE
jgi:hypothetical protein